MTNPIKQTVEIDLEVDTNVIDSSKSKWFTFAKVLNELRLFPRFFIGSYIYVFYEYSMWMMTLENPTTQQASLYSVVVGIGAAWFGLYVNSGKND